jgi:predicted Zn-dependent protease
MSDRRFRTLDGLDRLIRGGLFTRRISLETGKEKFMNHKNSLALAVAIPLLASGLSLAQQKPLEQLGKVSFPTSCGRKVQPQFDRAVAMLHSFWFQQGEKAFREILERDPSCAIANWGIAAILIGNTFGGNATAQDAQKAKEAIQRARLTGAKTERERFYIEAIAEYYDRFNDRPHSARMKSLADAFEVVAKRFPKDDEAQIFYAIYLTATQSPADKSFADTLKAAQILEPQFKKHPDHPGVAHYLIHSYDYPPIAEKGLNAAKRYADIAPSAPHALHMPSHIFTRVGAWEASAATNRRSVEVSRAENEPNGGLHATDYMVYAYMQLARDNDATQALQDARRVANIDRNNPGAFYALAAMPARIVIERGMWKEAAQLEPGSSKVLQADAMTQFARALGAARSGDAVAAEKIVQELARIGDGLKAAKNNYWATEVEVQRSGAAAWTAYAKGSRDEALTLMRSTADLEDKSEKREGPPARLVPARELLGEMLLEMKRPAEALKEFEASEKHDPNRFRGIYGAAQAAAESGDSVKAKSYFKRLVEMAGKGDPRPELEQAKKYLAAK